MKATIDRDDDYTFRECLGDVCLGIGVFFLVIRLWLGPSSVDEDGVKILIFGCIFAAIALRL